MNGQARHDLKSFENWKVRCKDRDSAVYHAELQHKVQRQHEAQKQAQSLFDITSVNWFASLEVLGSPNEVTHRIKATVNKLMKTLQVRSEEIYLLQVCNWSSPSLVSSAAQKCQATVLGALCNDATSSGRSLGCVFEPCHTYNKGQLWKQEEMLHKMLVNARCNIDGRFVLPFVERQDDRDRRPSVIGFFYSFFMFSKAKILSSYWIELPSVYLLLEWQVNVPSWEADFPI